MAELVENREAKEATEANPEKVTANAVTSLEANDKNYSKWIIGKGWNVTKFTAGGLLYGSLMTTLKLVEFSAHVLEHVARNMNKVDDLKFWSGLWESGKKAFKSDKSDGKK